MTEKISVLIVEDHSIVRKGIKALLSTEEKIQVVGEAGNGVEAVDLALKLQPDVILMDLKLPEKSGIEAISEIKYKNCKSIIMVLTSFEDDDKVFSAIKLGAQGYLLKDCLPEELINGIFAVHQGRPCLSPIIAMKVIREIKSPSDLPPTPEPLSEREMAVLILLARGFSNVDIGNELNISERTVGTHVGKILDKLHLANRTQAALYAVREGLAELE